MNLARTENPHRHRWQYAGGIVGERCRHCGAYRAWVDQLGAYRYMRPGGETLLVTPPDYVPKMYAVAPTKARPRL